jgi:tetratricopeptide (TPR) repeat protein
MRFFSIIILSIVFLLAAPTLYAAENKSGETAALNGAISQVEDSLNKKKAELSKLKEDLFQARDIVIQVEKKTKETTQKQPKETVKEQPRKKEVSIPPAVQKQAREEVKWAEDTLAQALKQLEKAKAKAASNPAAAQVDIRDAMDKADLARGWMERARQDANLAPLASPQPEKSIEPTPKRQMGIVLGKGEAFRQAEAIKLGERGFMATQEQQMADAVNVDPQQGILTLTSGEKIKAKPVFTVISNLSPGIRPEDVFKSTEVPGYGKVSRLNPEAHKILFSPEHQKQREKVGGVALAVTLDLLSYYGVPEFRRRGPATLVESPVLLSLGRLYNDLAPYAQSPETWETLPANLRYPGGVGRIYGFVLDPKNQDVFLVGTTGPRANAIDIDSLILGIRSVWAAGTIPRVSLDPLPDRPAGPQYSKVYEVPFHSTFAKIMLESDYAMKRITFGDMDVALPRFKKLNLQQAQREKKYFGSRYWLTPISLKSGDIHISPSSRSLLFNTGVHCLTEAQNAAHQFTGKTDEIDEKIAGYFSDSLPRLEQSSQISPPGIFLRLHGLVDVVTVCQLLRDVEVKYPLLEQYFRLPVRTLKGDASVPTFYPGLRVKTGEIKRIGGKVLIHYLMGGAILQARYGRHSLDSYQDAVTATLEYTVDNFPRRQTFVQNLDLTFTLPQGGDRTRTRIEYRILAGQTALAAQQYDLARTRFLEVLQEDPFCAEAWAALGSARSSLGQHQEAMTAIGRALELEPENLDFKETKITIFRGAGKNLDLSGEDGQTLRNLSLRFASQAKFLIDQGQPDRARELLTVASDLWGQNPYAFLVRSRSWPDPAGAEAVHDRQQAINYYRQLVQTEEPVNWRPALALALTEHALIRLNGFMRLGAPAPDATLKSRELVTEKIFPAIEECLAHLAEAKSQNPALSLAWSAEALGNILKENHKLDLDLVGDFPQARDLALQAATRFPNQPEARFSLGMANLLEFRLVTKRLPDPAQLISGAQYLLSAANEELTAAIRLDPTFGMAYRLRCQCQAILGRCSEAWTDFEQAQALLPASLLDPAFEQELHKFCPHKSRPPRKPGLSLP